MLHKSKSKKINQLKYALVIPIVALFLMGFNTEEVYVEKQNPEKSNSLETSKKIISEAYHTVITKDFTDEDFKRIIGEAQALGIKLTFTIIKRNDKNEIISINAAFTNENGSGTFNLNGKEPIKSFAYTQNEQGFGFHPLWQTNIVTDHLQVIGYDKKNVNTSQIIVKGASNVNGTTPLIIIDGKEISNKNINDVLDQDNIYSIDVLKGENTESLYGEKGKDGVIEITTKKDTQFKVGTVFDSETTKNTPKTQQTTPWKVEAVRNNVVFASSDTLYAKSNDNIVQDNPRIKNLKGNPLFVINGKVSSKKTAENLDQHKISSIGVFIGEEYTKKYGSKAKDGVIMIETTNESPYKHTIKINTSTLYIVNGKELPQEEFEKLNPDTVESMTVLKDETATKKYGEKGKNGVVEITTKK